MAEVIVSKRGGSVKIFEENCALGGEIFQINPSQTKKVYVISENQPVIHRTPITLLKQIDIFGVPIGFRKIAEYKNRFSFSCPVN